MAIFNEVRREGMLWGLENDYIIFLLQPGKDIERRENSEEARSEGVGRQGKICVISMQRSLDRVKVNERGGRRVIYTAHGTGRRGGQTQADRRTDRQTMQEGLEEIKEGKNTTTGGWRGQN